MPIGGVDLNLLVTLRALLEEGNVTYAGARVGMSQPAMSIALGRLRRHYKDELLVRSGRDYSLTPLAKALLPSVQESLRLIDRALDVSPGFDAAVSTRQFSIALSDYAVIVLIEPLLRRLRELAPGVGLELSPIPPGTQDSDRALLQHDLLITPIGFRVPGWPEVIFRDRLVCIVDPANPRLRDGRLCTRRPRAAAARGGHVRACRAEPGRAGAR